MTKNDTERPPTDAQLRLLYELICENWKQSKLLYDFSPDPDSFIFPGVYLAIFATPTDSSPEEEFISAYYIYPDGTYFVNSD